MQVGRTVKSARAGRRPAAQAIQITVALQRHLYAWDDHLEWVCIKNIRHPNMYMHGWDVVWSVGGVGDEANIIRG